MSSALQELMQQAYANNREGDAQRALQTRMQGNQQGNYQNQTLESMIAQATGQQHNPNAIQRAMQSPQSDIGGSPSIADVMSQIGEGKNIGAHLLNFLIPDADAYVLGEESTGADLKALNEAKILKEYGVDDDRIFKTTKWWLGHPDGKPRYEKAHGKENYLSTNELIFEKLMETKANRPDNADAIRKLLKGNVIYKGRVEDSVYDDQYPKAAAVTGLTNFDESGKPEPESSGMFYETEIANPMYQLIIGDPGKKGMEDPDLTFVHESQHAIDQQENFARGGSPDAIKDAVLANAARLGFDPELAGPWLETEEGKRFLFEGYQRLAGESQARLVEGRKDMSQAEMDADPFYKHYDRNIEDLLVRDPTTGKFNSAIERFMKGE